MDAKPAEQLEQPVMDREQDQAEQVPPKKDPKAAAGSVNPKDKAPFYEAVVQKVGRGKRHR